MSFNKKAKKSAVGKITILFFFNKKYEIFIIIEDFLKLFDLLTISYKLHVCTKYRYKKINNQTSKNYNSHIKRLTVHLSKKK